MVTHSDSVMQIEPSLSSRLRSRALSTGGWLCVGLDPDLECLPARIPRSPQGVLTFCRDIISAVADLVVAIKINFAFFEALGPEGWQVLQEVRQAVPSYVPVIADAKRGDIGNSSSAYAVGIYEFLGFDAVTVNPYLGWDALDPFLQQAGSIAFVLCRTSNPGADDYQTRRMEDGAALYLHVARHAIQMRTPAEVGLVVGATSPDAIRVVRAESEEVMLLVPGAGAQGGDAATAYQAGSNRKGENALINISRQVLFASPGMRYASEARLAAEKLRVQLRPESKLS